MVTEIELGIHRTDGALLVMPMCHANSLNFFGAFGYCGGVTSIYSRKSFDPEHCVRTLAEGGSTFTSLVPTHYIMMLGLPAAVRERYDLGKVTKLMISSAPARQDTKRDVMEMFRNSGLFELYGATEIGWATMLHPHEQYHQAGFGRARVRRFGADQAVGRERQRGARRFARRALLLHALYVRQILEAAREDRERLSTASIARSATWLAATKKATSTWSIARAT